MTNSVRCIACNWKGQVPLNSQICPNCNKKGWLAFWYNFKTLRKEKKK